MLALVGAQVDRRNRDPHGLEHGVLERPGFAHHGHDEAVVVLVPLVVQQLDAVSAPERLDDFFDPFQVAALAEIGDALDDSGHAGHGHPPSLKMWNIIRS